MKQATKQTEAQRDKKTKNNVNDLKTRSNGLTHVTSVPGKTDHIRREVI